MSPLGYWIGGEATPGVCERKDCKGQARSDGRRDVLGTRLKDVAGKPLHVQVERLKVCTHCVDDLVSIDPETKLDPVRSNFERMVEGFVPGQRDPGWATVDFFKARGLLVLRAYPTPGWHVCELTGEGGQLQKRILGLINPDGTVTTKLFDDDFQQAVEHLEEQRAASIEEVA